MATAKKEAAPVEEPEQVALEGESEGATGADPEPAPEPQAVDPNTYLKEGDRTGAGGPMT